MAEREPKTSNLRADLHWALERVKMFDSTKSLMPYQKGMIAMAVEIETLNEAVAGVREALAQFTSEDVVVMAKRARDEIERLNAQWEKAARLLNEFRPVTGTDEWVAVRVGALNYVLMAASPTPAVGPLVPAPESRDG
jgi:hypothetical protein